MEKTFPPSTRLDTYTEIDTEIPNETKHIIEDSQVSTESDVSYRTRSGRAVIVPARFRE